MRERERGKLRDRIIENERNKEKESEGKGRLSLESSPRMYDRQGISYEIE